MKGISLFGSYSILNQSMSLSISKSSIPTYMTIEVLICWPKFNAIFQAVAKVDSNNLTKLLHQVFHVLEDFFLYYSDRGLGLKYGFIVKS